MSADRATGAVTGITNFLFLAFILPGVIFLCFILLLFPSSTIRSTFPDLDMGIDVAVGAVIFLGLAITSIAFSVEIIVRWLFDKLAKRSHKKAVDFASFAQKIFVADRDKELGWYFWQLWGQSIMHWNIAWGVLLIYVIYKYINGQLWPSSWFSSWRDLTLLIIAANFICRYRFVQWHNALMREL